MNPGGDSGPSDPARGGQPLGMGDLVDPIVGIDLGTTNSVVAVAVEPGDIHVLEDDMGRLVQPSTIAFHPSGDVLVGHPAKERRVMDVANTVYSVKRLIGRRVDSPEVLSLLARLPFTVVGDEQAQPVVRTRAGAFSATDLSAIMLDHMRDIAEQRLYTDVTRAVITVPANFTDAQRAATESAGAIAGLDVAHVINEPTAAALAYGRVNQLNDILAVYDLGGGTFDITIVKLSADVYEVLGTAGHAFLGGEDIDEGIAGNMAELFLRRERIDLRRDLEAMQRLRSVAETLKIELSRRRRAMVNIDEIAYGEDGKPLSLRFEMTRDQLEVQARSVIEQTFPVCQEALRMAGLSADRVEEVLLVGGGTRMPYVRGRVASFFQRAPRIDVDPDTAIAMGAALQGMAMRRVLGVDTRRHRKHVLERYQPDDGAGGAIDGEPSGVRKRVRAPSFDPGLASPASEVAQVSLDDMGDSLELGLPQAHVPAGGAGPGPGQSAGPDANTIDSGRLDSLFDGVVTSGTDADDLGARSLDYGFVEDTSVSASTSTSFGRQTMTGRIDLTDMDDDPLELDLAAFLEGPDEDPIFAAHEGDHGPGARDSRDSLDLRDSRDSLERFDSFDPDLDESTLARQHPRGLRPTQKPAQRIDTAGEVVTDVHDPRLQPERERGPEEIPTLAGRPTIPNVSSRADLGVTAPQPTLVSTPPGHAGAGVPSIVDVTPRGLGVATVSGYCDLLVSRNQRLPISVTRVFTTSKDAQDTVRIAIYQGESRRIADNILLGDLVLPGIVPQSRGETRIEVEFQVDESGILRVRARDQTTGKETETQLDITGRQSLEDVARAAERLRHILR